MTEHTLLEAVFSFETIAFGVSVVLVVLLAGIGYSMFKTPIAPRLNHFKNNGDGKG